MKLHQRKYNQYLSLNLELLNILDVSVILIKEEKIIFFNQSFTKLTGYSDVSDYNHSIEFRSLLLSFQNDFPDFGEKRLVSIRHFDESLVDVSVSIKKIDSNYLVVSLEKRGNILPYEDVLFSIKRATDLLEEPFIILDQSNVVWWVNKFFFSHWSKEEIGKEISSFFQLELKNELNQYLDSIKHKKDTLFIKNDFQLLWRKDNQDVKIIQIKAYCNSKS